MRLLLALVLIFTTTGCASQSSEEEADFSATAINPNPLSFALEDASGNSLGYATPLNQNVLVAPDHLWQVGESLYYENWAIEVLARDFRHDLIYFKIPNLKLEQWPVWSDKPPGVGQILTWDNQTQRMSAPVLSTKAEFSLGNNAIEALMQLSVPTDPGSSGLPLYNADSNRIYGMLIATDTIKGVSYFVRSDTVLNLASQYLDLTQ